MMWIEVLNREGDVVARERIPADEARIGRAFDNDVVLSDPHVAPHHLRVSRAGDGTLVAEDLGTINGLYGEPGAQRVARLVVGAHPALRIGHTTLRVHDASQPVAPEKPLTPPRAHARWDLALGAVLFAAIVLLNWLQLTKEPSANAVALPLLGLATVIALWAGFWAVISRVFSGRAQFALQLRITLIACIALVAWDELTETLAFAFAWRELADHAALGAWAILAATCHAHLRAIGPRHLRAATGLVVALAGAAAAVHYASGMEARELGGERATMGELRPPSFRAVPPSSMDEFLAGAEAVRISVDQARLKEPPPGGALSDTE